MGGLAELEERDGELFIQGCSCPLSEAVREHTEVCRPAETLLTEVVGAHVRETCKRDGTPRCASKIVRQN